MNYPYDLKRLRKAAFIFLWFCFCPGLFAQSYWHAASNRIPDSLGEKKTWFRLDTSVFFQDLRQALPVSLPIEQKQFIKTTLVPCSNFTPELAIKYPAIQTYCNSTAGTTVRVDLYKQKLTAFILHDSHAYFIEPDTLSDLYVFTEGLDHEPGFHQSFECTTLEPAPDPTRLNPAKFRSLPNQKTSLRTYRLALALTGEFSRTHGNNVETVLAALNSHLSRINAVYVNENAIQFQLVANNDTLVFMDPDNDPYANGNVVQMLDQNPKVLNDRIGLNNYDVGHVFGTNAGGVARLGTTCGANKGAGVSSTFGIYTGIRFYHIPCHELGHQFSATHTFNFCDNENETTSSAFEPGSGSTIMSYAGASDCGSNYVQGISDPYFHGYSLEQIRTYSRMGIGSLCGTLSATANDEPLTLPLSPTNVTIPILTPFELEGTAIDDKETLTYTWEEMDLGQKSPLGMPAGTAPLFRSLLPGNSGTRTFPRIESILANTQEITEILPSTSRPLKFRLTARDNDPLAGGVNWSEIALQSDAGSGPFKITSNNNRDTFSKGGFIYLTWDVKNTDRAPVDCQWVDIWLSEDGGFSFNLPLKLKTANDGGEWISLPGHPVTKGRLKIKAVQHVFFDINDADLIIEDVFPGRPEVGLIQDIQTLCAGDRGEYQVISSPSSSGDSLLIQISNPFQQFFTITPSKSRLGPLDTLRLEVSADPVTPPGQYVIRLLAISSDTLFMDLIVQVVSANIALINPKDNDDQVPVLPVFQWEKLPAKDEYKIEVSQDPGFLNPVWSRLVTGDTMAVPEAELESNKIYFWRILPVKPCTNAGLTFATFHTISLACKTYSAGDTPRLISATGTPSVTSTIPVPDQIQLKQVRIPSLTGTHEFVGDLSVWLRAPSGDSITLWSRQCNNLSNFNLTLDDNAPVAVTCPLTDRKAHRPMDSLNKLIHSSSMGNWSLRLRDFSNGAGGSLDSWSLELCGSITSSGPVVTTNLPMDLFELRSAALTTGRLNFTDPDSEPQNIRIMLLQHPGLGTWLKGQDTLVVGDVFTQADLQAGLITVSAGLVRADTSELISLLAFDEKNNWSGRFAFRINILNDMTILTREESLARQFSLYPNPTAGRVYLENRSPSPARYRWLDPAGRMLGLGIIQANSKLQLLSNGPFTSISFIQLIQGNRVLVFKVVHLQ